MGRAKRKRLRREARAGLVAYARRMGLADDPRHWEPDISTAEELGAYLDAVSRAHHEKYLRDVALGFV